MTGADGFVTTHFWPECGPSYDRPQFGQFGSGLYPGTANIESERPVVQGKSREDDSKSEYSPLQTSARPGSGGKP